MPLELWLRSPKLRADADAPGTEDMQPAPATDMRAVRIWGSRTGGPCQYRVVNPYTHEAGRYEVDCGTDEVLARTLVSEWAGEARATPCGWCADQDVIWHAGVASPEPCPECRAENSP